MVMLTDRPAMTIAVDLGRKATKKQKNQNGRKIPVHKVFGLSGFSVKQLFLASKTCGN